MFDLNKEIEKIFCFDLDKELEKIKKMQKLELKKRKEEVKFTRSRLDDALSLAMLKLALDMNQRTKKEK